MIDCHASLEVRGLKDHAGRVMVPLEKVYAALKVDPTSFRERREARVALDRDLQAAVAAGQMTLDDVWHLVARSSLMPTLEALDRPDQFGPSPARSLTLGEAYRENRQLVILGKPGSGKTTLARWLALVMAKAMRPGSEDEVRVPRYQVFPDEAGEEEPFSLGAPRLPVLVRLSDYAKDRKRREARGEEPRTLFEFLGHHTWPGKPATYKEGDRLSRGRPLDAERLAGFIQEQVRRGRALLIFDGLDEVPASAGRDEVRDAVQAFLDEHVAAPDLLLLSGGRLVRDDPRRGGNQVVITSRIDGYQASALNRDVPHVLVEDMKGRAVEHFIDAWTWAIHAKLCEPGPFDVAAKERAREAAEGLKRAVRDEQRRGPRELMANPLMASLVVAVYHDRDGRLPERRVELYEEVIRNLAEVWRPRLAARGWDWGLEEIFGVMGAVAAHIHRHAVTGQVEEKELRGLLREHLARSQRPPEDPANPSPLVRQRVETLLRILPEDVGLLAERGRKTYGFLHLTFQEYLVARHLAQSREGAAPALLERIDDPRWLVPARMALEHASQTWASEDFTRLLLEVMAWDGNPPGLLPRGALLIVGALPELAAVPDEVIAGLARRLVLAYADREGLARFERLREKIEEAVGKLRQAGRERAAEAALADLLRRPGAGPAVAPAVAALLRRLEWFTPGLVEALTDALPHDSPAWGWPIDGALREAFVPPVPDPPLPPVKPKDPEKLAKYEQDQAAYQAARADYDAARAALGPRVSSAPAGLRFRAALESHPEWARQIEGDPDWLRLVLALYGGLGEYRAPETVRDYCRIAGYLQLEDNVRDPFTQFFGERYGADDPVYNMAVLLDTKALQWKECWGVRPRFAVGQVHRDSPLTDLVSAALAAGRPARSLRDELWKTWREGDGTARRAEALVALAALGEGTARPFAEELHGGGAAAEAARVRLRQLADSLRDPVVRAAPHLVSDLARLAELARAVPAGAATGSRGWARGLWAFLRRLGRPAARRRVGSPVGLPPPGAPWGGAAPPLTPERWADVVSAVLATAFACGARPVNTLSLYDCCPGEQAAYLLAEYLVRAFVGCGDDTIYEAAVALDEVNNRKTKGQLLVRALLQTPLARHFRMPSSWLSWAVVQAPPRTVLADDVPLAALTAIENSPNEISMVRHWALGQRFRSLARQNADLLPELLAFNLGDVGDRSQPLDTTRDLCPGLVDHPDPRGELLRMADEVGDPYYRARALLRLAPHLPEQFAALFARARRAAGQIADPHLKAQVLERALLVGPPDSRPGLLAEAARAAHAIANPDDRARALARLAFHQEPGEQLATVEAALGAADRVRSPSQRAEVLRLLLPLALPFESLWGKVGFTLEGVPAAWEHAKAVDLHGLPLLAASAALAGQGPEVVQTWAPAVLSALAADALRPQATRDSVEGLWAALLRDANDQTVAALLAHGQNDRLVFTRTAALVLDSLLARGRAGLLRPLLPLLAHPEPETLPVLERWLAAEDEGVRDHAALLLTEVGRIGPRTVPSVVRLLQSPDDRTRRRAARTLNNPLQVPAWPTLSVSLLGRETVEMLTAETLRHFGHRPAVALVLRAFHCKLVYDDPALIAEWARRAAAGGPGADVAEQALTQVEALTPPVWQALVEALRLPCRGVRVSVLRSVCQVLFRATMTDERRKVSEAQWAAFLAVVPEIDRAALRDVPVLLGGPRALVHSAEIALGRADDDAGKVQAAEEVLLSEHGSTLGDLLGEPAERMRQRLAAAADNNIYYPNDPKVYLESGRKAAEPVKNNKPLFRLLLHWLVRSLEASPRDPPLYAKVENMLLAVAGAAGAEPMTLLNLATDDPALARLEPLLVGAATHRGGRAGRCSAITLLGYLRRGSREALRALQAAMSDVEDVRQGAFLAVVNFRNVEDADLAALVGRPETATGLYHASAMAAFATAQLLVALARGERTTAGQRAQIQTALADAIRHPGSHRVVHFGYTAAQIPDMPRLDQAFYRSLMRVAGLD